MLDGSAEAARWFAASRRGVMLHSERIAFEAWRRDPANAARLNALQAIWDALEPAIIDPGLEPAMTAHSVSASYRRHFTAIAVVVAVMVVILPRIDGLWWNTLDWWSR
jgi:ferric-dicitrate binding protein FerR (iron transport regulator)